MKKLKLIKLYFILLCLVFTFVGNWQAYSPRLSIKCYTGNDASPAVGNWQAYSPRSPIKCYTGNDASPAVGNWQAYSPRSPIKCYTGNDASPAVGNWQAYSPRSPIKCYTGYDTFPVPNCLAVSSNLELTEFIAEIKKNSILKKVDVKKYYESVINDGANSSDDIDSPDEILDEYQENNFYNISILEEEGLDEFGYEAFQMDKFKTMEELKLCAEDFAITEALLKLKIPKSKEFLEDLCAYSKERVKEVYKNIDINQDINALQRNYAFLQRAEDRKKYYMVKDWKEGKIAKKLGSGTNLTAYKLDNHDIVIKELNSEDELTLKNPDKDILASSLLASASAWQNPNAQSDIAVYKNEKGDINIVSDYCDMDLWGYFEKNPNISINEMLKIIGMVINGLDIMHKRGIFHLDIKPENILVKVVNGKDIKLVIIDFPEKYSSKGLTADGIIYTEGYEDPQLYKEDFEFTRELGKRYDIFSVLNMIWNLVVTKGNITFNEVMHETFVKNYMIEMINKKYMEAFGISHYDLDRFYCSFIKTAVGDNNYQFKPKNRNKRYKILKDYKNEDNKLIFKANTSYSFIEMSKIVFTNLFPQKNDNCFDYEYYMEHKFYDDWHKNYNKTKQALGADEKHPTKTYGELSREELKQRTIYDYYAKAVSIEKIKSADNKKLFYKNIRRNKEFFNKLLNLTANVINNEKITMEQFGKIVAECA